MGLYSNKEDPLALFKQGKISEYKLQNRLEKITPEEIGSFDTKSWSRFLIEINEMHHHMPVFAETKKMIIERLNEESLIDIALKPRGNDYICALAIFEMKDQDSLRITLQGYHRFTPFKIFMWQGEKLGYTDRPVGTPFERGGLAVWALLQRIDQEHFNQAWDNCGRKSQWVDQLRKKQVNGRYFSGYGFPGWEGFAPMNYMDLLPEVEHRIVLAESGSELKKPYHEHVKQ